MTPIALSGTKLG